MSSFQEKWIRTGVVSCVLGATVCCARSSLQRASLPERKGGLRSGLADLFEANRWVEKLGPIVVLLTSV
jgi:hypothetical protein